MEQLPEIPGYNVLKMLGRGVNSTAYLAIRKRTGQEVTLKLMDRNLFPSDTEAERFIDNIKRTSHLQHANIVKIFDIFLINGYCCIVSEFFEESLREKIQATPGGKMAPEEAISLLEKVFAALDYAHFMGINHDNLKPESIMFRKDGSLAVMDFMILPALEKSTGRNMVSRSRRNLTYRAPEHLISQADVNGLSDIYSVGVIFYELLTGTKPYKDDDWYELSQKIRTGPVPTLPGSLSRYQPLINTLMAKKPNERPSTGAQFSELRTAIKPRLLPSNTPRQPNPYTMVGYDIPNPKPRQNRQVQPPFTDSQKLYSNNFDIHQSYRRPPPRTSSLPRLFKNTLIMAFLIWAVYFLVNTGNKRTNPVQDSRPQTEFVNKGKMLMLPEFKNILNALEALSVSTIDEEIEHVHKLKQNPNYDALQLNTVLERLIDRKKEMEYKFIYHSNRTRDFFRREDYVNAKQEIQLAKQIKSTDQLYDLEKKIDSHLEPQNNTGY